jgi:hypothetical protein
MAALLDLLFGRRIDNAPVAESVEEWLLEKHDRSPCLFLAFTGVDEIYRYGVTIDIRDMREREMKSLPGFRIVDVWDTLNLRYAEELVADYTWLVERKAAALYGGVPGDNLLRIPLDELKTCRDQLTLVSREAIPNEVSGILEALDDFYNKLTFNVPHKRTDVLDESLGSSVPGT